jgi:hypothetical protein
MTTPTWDGNGNGRLDLVCAPVFSDPEDGYPLKVVSWSCVDEIGNVQLYREKPATLHN